MNERIEELADSCWEDRPYGPNWFNYRKFAELIVAECADLADNIFEQGSPPNSTLGEQLVKHFRSN